MLINKQLILASAVTALTLSASSCRKFSNVNTDPNVAQTATVQTLLPAAQLHTGAAVGTDLQIMGSIWAQYWTQAPGSTQYKSLEQFAPKPADFESSWTSVYAGAENFAQLYNLADSQHRKQYKAIALIMQAYTFQVITDGWGDAPFKQALKGRYTDGHMINPVYDAQSAIYNGILSYLDSANKLISTADPVKPGADDLIYGGDMNKWTRFANTLRLKILLRAIDAPAFKAAARIDSFYAKNPQFITDGGDAKIAYGFGAANNNPLYTEQSAAHGGQHLAGSSTCIDTMNSNHDYRVAAFYEGGSGITQGSYQSAVHSGFAIPGVSVAGNVNNSSSASAPVNLLTSAESYLLQAEAAARGLGNATTDDATLFYKGIQASFNYYAAGIQAGNGASATQAYTLYTAGDMANSIPAAYWAQYPVAGSQAEKLRHIITQKWFAMCGNQGFEAWTEWRRTGYPDFLVNPVVSTIGAQKPARLLYPATEATANASFPGLKPLTARVWWDVN